LKTTIHNLPKKKEWETFKEKKEHAYILKNTSAKHTVHTDTNDSKHTNTHMGGDVDVVGVPGVHVDDMEAHAGAVDDL
jgi:hypothetical protein